MKLPLQGGCLCRVVRYEITLEPVFVYACHCADCQRSTSSAFFSIGVVVPDDGFKVTENDNTRLIFGGIAASNGRVKQRRVCTTVGLGFTEIGATMPDTLAWSASFEVGLSRIRPGLRQWLISGLSGRNLGSLFPVKFEDMILSRAVKASDQGRSNKLVAHSKECETARDH